jgi:hypothetical protein
MDFKRSLSVQEYDSWLELGESLQGCDPQSDKADSVIWALEPKSQFSTKSLYRFLTNRGVPSKASGVIWKSKIPLKINFFYGKCSTTNYRLLVIWLRGGGKGILTVVFVIVQNT